MGHLLAVPLAAAALVTYSATPARRVAHAQRLLDGLIIATAVLAVSWQTVLGPVYRASTGSLPQEVLTLAYPIGDVVTVSFGKPLAAAELEAVLRLPVAGGPDLPAPDLV